MACAIESYVNKKGVRKISAVHLEGSGTLLDRVEYGQALLTPNELEKLKTNRDSNDVLPAQFRDYVLFVQQSGRRGLVRHINGNTGSAFHPTSDLELSVYHT